MTTENTTQDDIKTLHYKAACLMGLEVEWVDFSSDFMPSGGVWAYWSDTDGGRLMLNLFEYKDQLVDLEEAVKANTTFIPNGVLVEIFDMNGDTLALRIEEYADHPTPYHARVTAVLRCAAAYYDAMQEKGN